MVGMIRLGAELVVPSFRTTTGPRLTTVRMTILPDRHPEALPSMPI